MYERASLADDDQLLTFKEIAALTKCSVKTISRHLRRANVPVVYIGASMRVRAADVREFIAAHLSHE